MNKEILGNRVLARGRAAWQEMKDFHNSDHYNSGLPVVDIILGGAALVTATYAGIKTLAESLVRVPPGFQAVRVRLGKRIGVKEEGTFVKIPNILGWKIEQDVLVDMRPVLAATPAEITAYAQDQSEIRIDIGAVLVPGDSSDLIALAGLRPVIRISEDSQLIQIAGTAADTAARKVIPGKLRTTKDLGKREIIEALQEEVRISVQGQIDEATGDSDPRIRAKIKWGLERGIPRRDIRAGILVAGVLIRELRPGDDVLEAMQREAGAAHVVRAEKKIAQGLGRNYAVDRRARAAVEAARDGREGTTVVVGMGGDDNTVSRGVLGKVGRRERDNPLDRASDALRMRRLK